MKDESEEPEDVVEGDGEEDIDQDAEESGDEKSDCRYKIPHMITVYITLPNGDEEILTNYDMCFTDKSTKADAEQAKEDAAKGKDP